jgi:hypothetical protein
MTDGDSEDIDGDFIVEMFGRHIVLLYGTYIHLDENGKPKPGTKVERYYFTGWVCTLLDRLHIVTAGHAVDEFFLALRQRSIHLLAGYIADSFGRDARHRDSYPFQLQDLPTFYRYSESSGLDYALIRPTEMHANLIATNGLLPFDERQWSMPSDVTVLGYVVIGFPLAIIPPLEIPVEFAFAPTAHTIPPAELMVILVEKVEPHPEDIRPTNERFAGVVVPELPFAKVTGMSGGPIIAIARGKSGQEQYFVEAIQSKQVGTTRRIYGCPVKLFMDAVLREIEAEGESAFRTFG